MSTTARAYRTERSTHGWRERLDARISRCPNCDQWRLDLTCQTCGTTCEDGGE